MRLLLAEDEKSLSKAVKAILEAGKYSVDAVFDGEEALDYLETDTYDGVILDIMMPKKLISAEKFMEKIWGFDTEADISVVWVYISYLRKKFTSFKADIGVMEINGDENEWLSDIKTQVRRLTRLTNDLIHLSKLDEGKDNLKFTDFSISELAIETVNSFTSLAKVNGKKLTAKVEPKLTLNGDIEGIRELLNIIFDNAIKYSAGEGNINFELKKKSGHIIIEASNLTENLTKENVEHLFDRFYRADASRNSETGGHGIGLSMAKAMVEAHG
ncbi:MAG: ATP-binding protein [Catonella sp.]|uniref:ATP-binding protein n=1 Tax=Catonella sp. TaxID=2382125 RepID=UPI003FA0EBC5